MNRLAIALVTLAIGCQGSKAAERGATVYVPSPNAATTPPVQRTLTTAGKATLVVVPDVADVRIRLEVEKVARSTQAAEQINGMKARLLNEVNQLRLKSDQVIVSHIDLHPIYSPYVKGRLRRIVGYNASSSVTIELRDFDRIAPVLDAAVRSGATTISTQFRSTKLTEFKRKVYDMALKAARAKAEHMAEALDIKSLRIRTVAEGQVGGGWYGWQSSSVANSYDYAPRSAGGATSAVTPDSKELTLTISLVYEIL